MLMRAGYDDDTKIAALHAATQNDHASVVQLLLKVGGDIINKKDEKGCSPWMKAASRGHIRTIHVLLQNGAETSVKNNAGKTAMDIAIARNDQDTIRLLTKIETKDTFDIESMLDNDDENDYDDIMDRTEDPNKSEGPKQRLQIELTSKQARKLLATLRQSSKAAMTVGGKSSSVSVAGIADPAKEIGTDQKGIDDIVNILQKQLDTSTSIQSPRVESPSSRQLQRSSTLGLDIEHDPTKPIPLSTLQRAFTWKSDDDDVNNDPRKEV